MPVEYGIGQRHGFDPSKRPTTGRIVDGQFLGVSGHYFDPLFGAVYSVYSDDEGRTWDRNEDGDLIIMLDWSTTYSYVFEPTLAEAAPGVILMVMRTGLGRLFQAWSYKRWSDVDTASALAVCRQHDAGGDLLAAINRSPAYHLEPRERRGSEARFEQDVHLVRHQQKRRQLVGVLPERGVGARADAGRATPGTTAPPGRDGIPAGDSCARTGRAIHSRGRFFGRWSYPTVTAFEDRVFITHSYTYFEPHPTKAEMVQRGGPRTMLQPGDFNGKLKVLPLTWLYGGKEPANNPFLPRVHDPAQP